MGQSMGSAIGVTFATIDKRLKGLVLSGSGGILAEVAVCATELLPMLESIVELTDGQALHAHPLLHAMQHLWDLLDPVAKARHVIAEPREGIEAKDVFMPAGIIDGYFSPIAQTALAVGLDALETKFDPIWRTCYTERTPNRKLPHPQILTENWFRPSTSLRPHTRALRPFQS